MEIQEWGAACCYHSCQKGALERYPSHPPCTVYTEKLKTTPAMHVSPIQMVPQTVQGQVSPVVTEKKRNLNTSCQWMVQASILKPCGDVFLTEHYPSHSFWTYHTNVATPNLLKCTLPCIPEATVSSSSLFAQLSLQTPVAKMLFIACHGWNISVCKQTNLYFYPTNQPDLWLNELSWKFSFHKPFFSNTFPLPSTTSTPRCRRLPCYLCPSDQRKSCKEWLQTHSTAIASNKYFWK